MIFDSTVYERQCGQGRCGAATLVMIYRSFGLAADQETVWNELQGYSTGRTRTFHLARNALEHALSAIVVRVREPAAFLSADLSPIRLIPVCRICHDSTKGHFSLFLGTDLISQTVTLHDPQFGPHRTVSRAEFLELWTPHGTGDEITRNVAVLIAESRNAASACWECSQTFFLDPLLPFADDTFETMFCPYCDAKCLPRWPKHEEKNISPKTF